MSGLIYQVMSNLRKRNYRLFRTIVDSPITYKVLSSASSSFLKSRQLDSGIPVYLNPIYHSRFAEADIVAEYEPEVKHTLEKLLEHEQIAYDVGANIGWFTIVMSERHTHSRKFDRVERG